MSCLSHRGSCFPGNKHPAVAASRYRRPHRSRSHVKFLSSWQQESHPSRTSWNTCFSHASLLSFLPIDTQTLHQAISILYEANRNFAPGNLGSKKLCPFKHCKRSKKLNFSSQVWWCTLVIPARKTYIETERQEDGSSKPALVT